MGNILTFIADETDGRSYKSYKYCFEAVEVPAVEYEDKKDISVKKKGESDKSIITSRSVAKLAKTISKEGKPLFRYFLDGSRRTYKIDDIAYGNRLFPVIAGQIGVGCCERKDSHTFKPVVLKKPLVIALPECANSVTSNDELYFNNLIQKLNKQKTLQARSIQFEMILPYPDAPLKEGEKYELKGIAKIQDEMVDLEKRIVKQLAKERKLNAKAYLIKDGTLEYSKIGSGEFRDLSAIKANYSCVVGVSKMFNPESLSRAGTKDIARKIAELKLYHRTPAIRYSSDRIPDVDFAVWYLRIRNTLNPYDGIVKIEKILLSDKEDEEGLDTDEVDFISANIVNERNPVCYGQDKRWAKHLYPVHLTETFIKSQYLSDIHFTNLF